MPLSNHDRVRVRVSLTPSQATRGISKISLSCKVVVMDSYDSDGDGDGNDDAPDPDHVIVEVFTQSMSELVGKRKVSGANGLRGVEIQIVDVTELYEELYWLWSTRGNLDYCRDEEENILAMRRIDKPIDFEPEEHPLKDFSNAQWVLDWLNNRRGLHIDDTEMYGLFGGARSGRNGNGQYTLKSANDHGGAVSVWPKEIYAAVHAARDCGRPPRKLYEEYMKRSMSYFVNEGT